MTTNYGPLISVAWLSAIPVASIMGARKGRPTQGFVLGLLLSWLGVLLMVFVEPTDEVKIERLREQQRLVNRSPRSRNNNSK